MDPEMSQKNFNVCVTAARYKLQVKWSKDLVGGPWDVTVTPQKYTFVLARP